MHTHRLLPRLLSCLFAGGALLSLPALASPNIVSNGSFETGDFSGWSGTATTDPFNGVACPGSGAVAQGSCAAFFGALGGDDALQQVLTTTAGTQYFISFAVEGLGDVPSDLSLQWGGTTLYTVSNPDTGGAFGTQGFYATASGAATTLSFNVRDDIGFIYLDAVSVTAVPEPTTLALAAIGLAGLWAGRKRIRP